MSQIVTENKIKVFLSSICGQSKYDAARLKIKSLIEDTNLASVYLFEDGMASTQSAEQEYLYAIDDSDVCMFLIDNADGASDAVLKEINRSKGHNKKSLYLFCRENQLEPTQIQKELKGAKGVHYLEANSFDELISKGYTSLIYDITTIYRNYCKGRLLDTEFENNSVAIGKIESLATQSFKKQLLRGIDRSKGYMSSIVFNDNCEKNKTSEFDAFCLDFLKVIFGEKQIREFNTSLLLEELEKKQSKSLYRVVELRWKAIQAYYGNDLAKSIQYMNQSLEAANINSLPTWIINDIRVDLRNLHNTKNMIDNCYSSESQKPLDECEELLFYPVIDRLEKEFNIKLVEQNFESKTESPYTTHLGNNIYIYTDFITNIFVVSVFNGSLTHILRIFDRLKSMTFSLCEKYDDWKFRILLLKFSMINGDSTEFGKIISSFNEILGKMNAADTISLYKMASCIPIVYKKIIAKLEVFRYLGYYFSDRDYQDISKELIEEINKWICDDKKIICVGGYIFKALQNNSLRFDNTEIAKICCEMFQRKYFRWYDDVLELIADMGIKKVENEIAIKLISEIIKIINDETEKSNLTRLEAAIIAVRKSNNDLTKELEHCVFKKMPKFYQTDYSLEVLTDTLEKSEVHIKRYIEMIRNQNETQGLNGVYTGYGNNPYITIINLIRNGHLALNCESIEEIVTVIKDTLLKPNQTVSAKIDAIQLLIFLKNYLFKANYSFNILLSELIENQAIVETGFENDLFDKKSKLTLQFNFLLLQLCFGTISYSLTLEMISIYNNQEDYEKIQSLCAIANLMDNRHKIFDERNLYIFVQYVLGLCSSKSHDIRYNAVKALLQMCTTKISDVIMTQLSKMMESDIAPIKFLILNNIVDLKQSNEEIAALILQKAKVDNHFLVREKASK